MRLINTSSLELHEFASPEVISYAIFSHTWGEDEVSFQDMLIANGETSHSIAVRSKKGFDKIVKACRRAAEDGVHYIWIDTCCIDKSSSAELSEAINSMFQWYQRSKTCYVYLADVAGSSGTALDLSRWFTRGWTLQELLAPKSVTFLDSQWRIIGTKMTMAERLQDITGIEEAALQGESLAKFSVARRMSWASERLTTRPEDRAYSLLGIFDVHIPILYGEGENAFLRLQHEIIKASADESIFAWPSPAKSYQIANASQQRGKVLLPSFEILKRPEDQEHFSDSGLGPSVQTDHVIGAPASNLESRVYEISESENDINGSEDLRITSRSHGRNTPNNVSNCPSEEEPADDDLQSILTHPDDVDSLAPSEPSVLLHNAEMHTASILISNESLRLVCQEARSIVGRRRSCRQIARLLKYLYFGLFETSTDNTQKRAINFLRSRWSRTRIAEHVLEGLNPESEDGKEKSISQDDVDKNIMMEKFLAQLDVNHHRLGADHEAEFSDSDSDISSQDQTEEDFKKLREIENFLQTSPALTSMTYKLSRFLLPAPLIELSQKMVSIPASQISLIETDSRSWVDAMKLFFQTITAEDWSWHPLLPPKRLLKDDEARVCWNCHCGIPLWAEIPKRYLCAYRLMLVNRPTHEKSSHICWRRKYLFNTDRAGHLAATHADDSGQASGMTARGNCSSAPSGSSPAGSTSTISTLTPPGARAEGAHNGKSSNVSIPVQPNFPSELFVLFAVSGKRMTLDLENVNVQAQPTDQSFFIELLRKYRRFRGFWRCWLSLWTMNHCDFVRLHKVRANRIIFGAVELPNDHYKHMYEWSPRPPDPDARMPPIDPHEFYMAFNTCRTNCLRGRIGWHDCLEPLEGIDSMENIPKRKEAWQVSACHNKEIAWGIQAKLEISPTRMFLYHCIMLVGPFMFWAVWQSFHPDDLQGASTPATIALMLLSLWWTVLAGRPLLRRQYNE